MALAWVGYEPVLLVCGVFGLLLLSRSLRDRRSVLLLAPPLVLAMFFLPYDGAHVRYLMPATPFLALGAARLLVLWASRPGAWRVAACVLLALPLVQAARLDLLLGRTDTRDLAARELPALLPADARVALDGYGPPLEPTAESVAELNERRAAMTFSRIPPTAST